MTQYLIYRHGSNKANQHMCDKIPVAIVEAKTRSDACATERHDPPGYLDPYAPAYAVLDNNVTVWANQRLSAIPLTKAPIADIRTIQEQ